VSNIQKTSTYIRHSPSLGRCGNKLDLMIIMIMQAYCELEQTGEWSSFRLSNCMKEHNWFFVRNTKPVAVTLMT